MHLMKVVAKSHGLGSRLLRAGADATPPGICSGDLEQGWRLLVRRPTLPTAAALLQVCSMGSMTVFEPVLTVLAGVAPRERHCSAPSSTVAPVNGVAFALPATGAAQLGPRSILLSSDVTSVGERSP